MSSVSWRVLGKGSVLGSLRADLRKAAHDVLIIGPWIDRAVAEALTSSCAKGIRLRVLCRPLAQMTEPFAKHAAAAMEHFASRPQTELRTLATLHAKVALLDDSIVYCGSANFYSYSLQQSHELVLRGPLDAIPGMQDEVETLWSLSEVASAKRAPTRRSVSGEAGKVEAKIATGFHEEVIDPIAAEVLRSVRGAFVLGRRR